MIKNVSQAANAVKTPLFPGRYRTKEVFVRRFAEVVTALSVAALLALFVPLRESSRHSSTASSGPGPRAVDATTIEVLDGDTILVRIDNKVEKVRLIGIDSPEAVVNDKALYDAQRSHQDVKSIVKLGRLASQYTRSVVMPGTLLHITFDRQREDHYGRLLGYVFLPDNSMLNERIVAEGYAASRTYPPNTKFEDRLDHAFHLAQTQQKGLWKRKDHRVLEVVIDNSPF